jgi:hypothetical protein
MVIKEANYKTTVLKFGSPHNLGLHGPIFSCVASALKRQKFPERSQFHQFLVSSLTIYLLSIVQVIYQCIVFSKRVKRLFQANKELKAIQIAILVCTIANKSRFIRNLHF